MKKGILCILFVLLFPLAFLFVQCQFEAAKEHDGSKKNGRAVGEFAEEKKYSNAALEDKFAGDRVVIVLNKAASMNLDKTYTEKDFPEIKCVRVTESTRLTKEIVRQQIEAKRTGNWSKLQKRIELGMLIDVEKFRRILDIHLPEKNKENVLRAIKLLENREDILYAGPDYYMQLASLPYPEPDHYSWQEEALNSMSLPDAWEITVGRTGIMVGVLDSGIQADHPALYDLVNRELSRDFTTDTDPDGYVYPYGLEDPSGHGTHVSGIIATNGTGVAGSCWGVSLVSLRVFGERGLNNNASRISYAIAYAESNLIPILNFSGYMESQNIGFTGVLTSIQQYSGLFVCAAGNYGVDNDQDPTYPANYTCENYGDNNIVSVGALDNNDERADTFYFSSHYGAVSVDLFAPGTDIASTLPVGFCPNGGCMYCHTLYGGGMYIADGYHTLSGTSMAAPYVAGVAALIKSLQSQMTGADLKTALRNSVDILPQLIGLCNTGGKINAYKAVNYTPIAGSMDITFDGTNITTVQGDPVGKILLGKFHLFMNSTCVIAPMGKLSFPIANYAISDTYLQCGPVPAGIQNHINRLGAITLRVPFYAPCSDIYGNYNLNYSGLIVDLRIYSSGAHIYYNGYPFYNNPIEYLLPADKRKIYVE